MSTKPKVQWEEPPHPKVGPGATKVYFGLLEPLTAHPKRWARIREFASPTTATTTASKLRRGDMSCPPGEWEFVSRTVDGKGVIFARYMGNGAK